MGRVMLTDCCGEFGDLNLEPDWVDLIVCDCCFSRGRALSFLSPHIAANPREHILGYSLAKPPEQHAREEELASTGI
jgi:hypothetical protein